MFGGKEAPEAVAEEELPEQTTAGQQPSTKTGPSAEQITAIKAAIANASTLDEVRRLEDALKTGNMPSELAGNGAAAMEEG